MKCRDGMSKRRVKVVYKEVGRGSKNLLCQLSSPKSRGSGFEV